MNTKVLYAAIAVIALAVIGLFVYNNRSNDQLNSESQTTQDESSATSPAETTSPATSQQSTDQTVDEGRQTVPEDAGETAGVFQISYDGTKFAPANLTIKNGDVVVFKNDSSKSFWPASGPHPQHTNYPEFDAKKALGPGQTYQFKFTKTGEWGFHDHLNPSAFGKIIVQ